MTDSMSVLHDQIGILSVALARWVERDDAKAQSEVRQAANTAMDAIDAMLAKLYVARSALVTEIRQSDDASATRADGLLIRMRQGRNPVKIRLRAPEAAKPSGSPAQDYDILLIGHKGHEGVEGTTGVSAAGNAGRRHQSSG
jgi:hypothetical protein